MSIRNNIYEQCYFKSNFTKIDVSKKNLTSSDIIIYIGLITALVCISMAYYIALHRFLVTNFTNAHVNLSNDKKIKKFFVKHLKCFCVLIYSFIFVTIICFPILHKITNDSRYAITIFIYL